MSEVKATVGSKIMDRRPDTLFLNENFHFYPLMLAEGGYLALVIKRTIDGKTEHVCCGFSRKVLAELLPAINQWYDSLEKNGD